MKRLLMATAIALLILAFTAPAALAQGSQPTLATQREHHQLLMG